MSYDTGEQQQAMVSPLQSDEAVRARALQAYQTKVDEIQKSINSASDELLKLATKIEARKDELQGLYATRVETLGTSLLQLTSDVSVLESKRDLIINDIERLEKTKASVLNGLAKKEIDLNSDRRVLNNEIKNIKDASLALNQDRLLFEKERADWVKRSQELNTVLANREKAVLAREQTVQSDADQLESISAKLEGRLVENTGILKKIEVEKTALIQKQAELAPVIATAAIVSAQAAKNEAQTKELKDWYEQNLKDAQEVKVAKIAISNQQADLNIRQKAIQDAEKRIGS